MRVLMFPWRKPKDQVLLCDALYRRRVARVEWHAGTPYAYAPDGCKELPQELLKLLPGGKVEGTVIGCTSWEPSSPATILYYMNKPLES